MDEAAKFINEEKDVKTIEEALKGARDIVSETVAEKPAFKDALRHRRLLIPVNGFFEWRQVGKDKEAYYINFPKNELFAFAGLSTITRFIYLY